MSSGGGLATVCYITKAERTFRIAPSAQLCSVEFAHEKANECASERVGKFIFKKYKKENER